ncbi:helix-turn-helix domain-containing protein [Caldicellulosiruptor acetigenus]|uniref:DNA binding domain protein, excisionase family n=1 Tax=Caldicellulosiruptor acetigenus 6A TaxID=632516 RepID=G2PXC6_9FIRM|nr:helix-turn-helix domain-containing protein [Caldicellulosiruptor acetigenus]AEM74790.1 DNA binding domain protein, excisionase family [Caldicellulosiruptor acetigenus 6A]
MTQYIVVNILLKRKVKKMNNFYDYEKLTYTPKELAKVLNISLTTVFKLIKQKEIPVIRIGRKVLIPKAKLKDWIDKVAQ